MVDHDVTMTMLGGASQMATSGFARNVKANFGLGFATHLERFTENQACRRVDRMRQRGLEPAAIRALAHHRCLCVQILNI